jgi:hypothetical protein
MIRGASPIAACALFAALAAQPGAAQLPDASASGLALAGNNTALARSFGAMSVNPAGLGMPESGFSLTIAPVKARVGIKPIGLGDLYEFQGVVVPTATKELWLEQIAAAGGETGSVGAEVTGFALTFGSVGFQLSTVASSVLDIPGGVAEALLYGNAGRTGEPVEISLADAATEGFAATTAAMGFGLAVNENLSFGMTGKYTVGHAVVVGRAESGSFEVDPLRLSALAPVVGTCFDELQCEQDFMDGGSGFGLDLGVVANLGTITVGASVQNVISNFSWNPDVLGYRPGTLLFEEGEFEQEFDELPFEDAPADLQEVIRDFTFKPGYRLGAAMDVSPMLTVTGDIQGELGDDGIELGPKSHIGVGAELRLGFLHLRGGAAKITAGTRYGAGGSLILGPVNLSTAFGYESGNAGDATSMQLVLSFGDR